MAVTVERLKAEIEADPARAIAGLTAFDAALTAVTRDRTVNIDVDKGRGMDDLARMTFTGLATAMQTAVQGMTQSLTTVSSTVGGVVEGMGTMVEGMSGVTKGMETLTDAAGGAGDAVTKVGTSMSGAGGGAGALLGTIMTVGGQILSIVATMTMWLGILSLVPGALSAAAAAAGALASALAPLIGLLGALVPLLGALMGAIGAVAAVAIPVMGAFTAMGAAEKQAGAAAEDTAAKHQALAAAVHQVKIATEQLADAREELAKAPHEAAEAIEDAHFAAAAAILAEQRAVLALQDAQRNLSDMQNEIARSGLKVTQQTDEFTGKIYDVAVTSQDAAVTARELRDAQLGIREAELALAQARDHAADTQMTLNEMEEKGIKNSDIMVRARRRVRDAEYALKQAHQQVAAAQKALNKSMTAGGTAAQNLADAMAKLTPTGQDFVKFLKHDFVPAFGDISKAVQDTMLPGIKSGLQSILAMMPTFESGLETVGTRIGTRFAEFFSYWATPENQKILDEMFQGLANVLGRVLRLVQPISRIIVSITNAARPLTNKILGGLLEKLDELADWMETDNGKEKTVNFFNRAYYWLRLWGNVLTPLGGILDSVLRAARPLARDILKKLADHFGDIDQNLKGSGFRNLKRWFNDQKPSLELFGGILADIFNILFTSTTGGKDSAFYKALESIKNDLLPAVEDLLWKLDHTNFAARLIEGLSSVLDLFNTILPAAPAVDDRDTTVRVGAAGARGNPEVGGSMTIPAPVVKDDTKKAFDKAGKILGGILADAIKYAMQILWEDARTMAWSAIVYMFDTLPNMAIDWFVDAMLEGVQFIYDGFVKYIFDPLVHFFHVVLPRWWHNFWDDAGDAFEGIWDPLVAGFQNVMGFIARLWNSTVGGRVIDFPGFEPWTIPMMNDPSGYTPPRHNYPATPSGNAPGNLGGGTGDDVGSGGGDTSPHPGGAQPRPIVFNNTYNTDIDPMHVAREQAWQLAGAGVR